MSKLLLVEDEESIANGLKFNLEMEGHDVKYIKDGKDAKEVLFDKNEKFELIIMDIMLPNISGYDLCHALRKNNNYTPILMLTAKNFQRDKIKGLQLGADDYITKPFDLEELLIRIDVLLRRNEWSKKDGSLDILEFGNNKINFDTFEVNANGELIKLTNLEIKLMKVFSENEGKVLSRDFLFEKVWDIKDFENLRTVDNFILRLRKYFEKSKSNPLHFHSIRGIGYKFTKNEVLS